MTLALSGEPPILAVIGDRHLVFSESHQAIHELSDFAAYVWRSLEAGMSADGVVGELVGTGVDPSEARSAVATTLGELGTIRAKTAVAGLRTLHEAPERLTRLTLLIADVAVQLNLSRILLADVVAVFGPLVAELSEIDMMLCATLVEDTVTFSSPSKPDWSCERAQFIPLLKAQLIDSVLASAQYEVAMHAAALVWEDVAVLLVGSPGAGKTTLAIALEKAGFQVLADDVVLLDEKGFISGLSFPFTAKSNSWPLLSRHWPGIVDHPSHCRPDGQMLCYVPLNPVADHCPRRISTVVLLNRQDDARTCVEALDAAAALGALVEGGATRDERLTSSGFTAFVEGLRGARCCRLTYSDLLEATDAVRGFAA